MGEIDDLRAEIKEMREILCEIRESSKNMDSHIGFINGIYDSYKVTLGFLKNIVDYSRNLLMFTREPLWLPATE